VSKNAALGKLFDADDLAGAARLIQAKRVARMSRVDGLTPELRQCVHDYGLAVVQAFLDCGIAQPRQLRHLVETVLNEFSPTRGSCSRQGIRTDLPPHDDE
jgi:hypothetical protein